MIKVVRTFGIGLALIIIVPYYLLYFKLSEKSPKSLYETSSYVPARLDLDSKVNVAHTKLNVAYTEETKNSLTQKSEVNKLNVSDKKTTNTSKKSKDKKKKKKKKLIVLKEIELRSHSNVHNDLLKKYDLNDLTSAPNCSFWNDTVMPPYVRLCKQKNAEKHPLITLFTTMHYGKKNINILNNTLRLWSELGPQVKRILFVSSPHVERHLVKLACDSDWEVMTAPLCDRNKLPVLKAMFLAAQQIHNSDYFGFANGDILFDESLLKTLEFVRKNYLKNFKETLFVGRRTNIKVGTVIINTKYHFKLF